MAVYPAPPMASRSEQKERARAARLEAEAAQQRVARRRTALIRLSAAVGLAVIVVIAAVLISSGGGDDSTPASRAGNGGGDAAAALFKGIPQKGVMLGDPKAKTTLVEFADLQCPFCAQYSNDALASVVDKYVRPGRLRYELRMRSFLGDDSARGAGAAAVAAKENKLYQFADVFYRRQGDENSGYVTDGFVRDIARASGVDPEAAVKGANNPGSQPLLAEAEQQASDLGSSSTPDFYLKLASGRLVPVPVKELTPDGVSSAIDSVLPKT